MKYAVLSDGLSEEFDHMLVDTGQHYDHSLRGMLYEQFGLESPEYYLDSNSDSAISQIGDISAKLYKLIQSLSPRLVLCMGDTNSTFAAAISAVKAGVPVAHLEAGERNFTPQEVKVPVWSIPEETNRVLTDQVSHLLLCASQQAVRNLELENISGHIEFTGDIMYDLYLQKVDRYLFESNICQTLKLERKQYYFCTAHRALNTQDKARLSQIVEALIALKEKVIFPVHPGTEKMLRKFGLMERLTAAKNVEVLKPLDHMDTLVLIHHARRVITDSGGVLREAFYSGVPSIFLDNTTEWLDILGSQWTRITGAEVESILSAVSANVPDSKPEPYGKGDAVDRTIGALKKCLNEI